MALATTSRSTTARATTRSLNCLPISTHMPDEELGYFEPASVAPRQPAAPESLGTGSSVEHLGHAALAGTSSGGRDRMVQRTHKASVAPGPDQAQVRGRKRAKNAAPRRKSTRWRRSSIGWASEFRTATAALSIVGDREIGVFRDNGRVLRLQQYLRAPDRPRLRRADHRQGRGTPASGQDLPGPVLLRYRNSLRVPVARLRIRPARPANSSATPQKSCANTTWCQKGDEAVCRRLGRPESRRLSNAREIRAKSRGQARRRRDLGDHGTRCEKSTQTGRRPTISSHRKRFRI